MAEKHQSNGTSAAQDENGTPQSSSSTPLEVIVIGAGIGGLTAAAALRKAGHNVKIFEQSKFANETGAAISVQPNAARALTYLGFDPVKLRAVICPGIASYDSSGTPLRVYEHGDTTARYGFPWYLVHRQDLHDELKRLALDPERKGPLPQLYLSSKVASIDAESGVVTLDDGSSHTADLIVGADGIYSKTRELVFNTDKLYSVGDSCFRFTLDADEIYNDPSCFAIAPDGMLRIIVSDDKRKRVVMYPCRDNTVMNFVCIQSDDNNAAAGSEGVQEDWSVAASLETLLASFNDNGSVFAPPVVNMLRKARNIKHYQMLQRPPTLQRWTAGRCVCLLGDAAHPMLPHQAQGGAQAIEDGVALGVLFDGNGGGGGGHHVEARHVREVLELYQQVRFARASRIEQLSREQIVGKPGINGGIDARLMREFVWGHDVVEYARHARSSLLLV